MDGIQHQGVGYPMPSTPWTVHDMTGVPRGVNLQKQHRCAPSSSQ